MKFVKYDYACVDVTIIEGLPTLYTYNVFKEIFGILSIPIFNVEGTDADECEAKCRELIGIAQS